MHSSQRPLSQPRSSHLHSLKLKPTTVGGSYLGDPILWGRRNSIITLIQFKKKKKKLNTCTVARISNAPVIKSVTNMMACFVMSTIVLLPNRSLHQINQYQANFGGETWQYILHVDFLGLNLQTILRQSKSMKHTTINLTLLSKLDFRISTPTSIMFRVLVAKHKK